MAAASVQHDPHNERVLAQLREGDMIEFPRKAYNHWGVYIGNEQVIHLTGEDTMQTGPAHVLPNRQGFDKAQVKIDHFWDVVRDCQARKNNSKDTKMNPLAPSEIVKKAKSKIGQIGYNVLYDNCEHFASWCRYGRSVSDQANRFMETLTLLDPTGLTSYIIHKAVKR